MKFTRESSLVFLFIFTCISCGYKDKEPVVRKGRFWFFLPVYGFEGGVLLSPGYAIVRLCMEVFYFYDSLQ